MSSLIIENLSVNLEDKNILSDINLQINTGEVSFLLGRNGAGKSTFAQTLMGNFAYKINSGNISIMDNDSKINLSELKPEERSKLGLFVSFQNPPEVEGVSLMSFLHNIYIEKYGNEDPLARSTFKFRKHIISLLERVNLKPEFIDRSLNIGFSGGEKKRSEILQMLLLKPRFVILDEVDSGLDVHAIEILQDAVKELVSFGSGILYISHNVDFVRRYSNSTIYTIKDGRITHSGKSEVIDAFVNDK